MAGLGLEALLLPILMSGFGLFAYSLRWKPSALSVFRTVRRAYLALFFVALFVVVWHLLSADYLIELVVRFVMILPLTLVSAYLAWMSETLLHRKVRQMIAKRVLGLSPNLYMRKQTSVGKGQPWRPHATHVAPAASERTL